MTPDNYEVVQTLHAGENSSWSISDSDGNTPGFCFDSPEAAQTYLDESISNDQNPMEIHI